MPRKLVFTDNDTGGVAEVPWRLDRDPTSEELDKIYEALKANNQFVKPVGLLKKVGIESGRWLADKRFGKVEEEPPVPWSLGETVKEAGGILGETVAYGTPLGRAITFGVPLATTALSGLYAIPTTIAGTAYGAAKKYLTGDQSISPLDVGLKAGTAAIETPHKFISKIPIIGYPVSYIGKAVQWPFEKTAEKVTEKTKEVLDKYTDLSENAKQSISEGTGSAAVNVGVILGALTGRKAITKAREKYTEYRDLARENLSYTTDVKELLKRINEAESEDAKLDLMTELKRKIDAETINIIKSSKYRKSVRENLAKFKEEEAKAAAEAEARKLPTVVEPTEPTTITGEPIDIIQSANLLRERQAQLSEQLREIDKLFADRVGEDALLLISESAEIKKEINRLKAQLPEDFKKNQKLYYRMVNGLKKKGVEESKAIEKATKKYGDIPKYEETNNKIKSLEDNLKELANRKKEPTVPPTPPSEPITITEPAVLPETQQYLAQLRDPTLNAIDFLKKYQLPEEKVEPVYPEVKNIGQSILPPRPTPTPSGEIVIPGKEYSYNIRERVKFGEPREREVIEPTKEAVEGERQAEVSPTSETTVSPERPTEPVRPTPEVPTTEKRPAGPETVASPERPTEPVGPAPEPTITAKREGPPETVKPAPETPMTKESQREIEAKSVLSAPPKSLTSKQKYETPKEFIDDIEKTLGRELSEVERDSALYALRDEFFSINHSSVGIDLLDLLRNSTIIPKKTRDILSEWITDEHGIVIAKPAKVTPIKPAKSRDEVINNLTSFTSKDSSRENITGFYVDNGDLVSTDGYKLFVHYGVAGPLKDKTIYKDKKGILKEIEGKFPNYKIVFKNVSKEPGKEYTLTADQATQLVATLKETVKRNKIPSYKPFTVVVDNIYINGLYLADMLTGVLKTGADRIVIKVPKEQKTAFAFDGFRGEKQTAKGAVMPVTIEYPNEIIVNRIPDITKYFTDITKPSKTTTPSSRGKIVEPKANIKTEPEKPVVTGEEGGGTTIYSGLDPIAAAKAFKAVAHDIEQAIPKLEDLGWSLYESGRRTAKEWAASMKSYLGSMWDQFKEHSEAIWAKVEERAQRRQLYFNVEEKIGKEPVNSPDILEKQMTGKVSKPTDPNVPLSKLIGDERGFISLDVIKDIDNLIRNYLTGKTSKLPTQPFDPLKYFGGPWGAIRKQFIHFLTVMDKFGPKAEGVREMIAEMDIKAMTISKYYKALEPVFTMHPDNVIKVLDFIAEQRVNRVRGMIPDTELIQKGFSSEEINLYKTVRKVTADMVDEIRDTLLGNIKLPPQYSIPRNTADAKALYDAVRKDPEASKTLVRNAKLAYETNRIADLEKDLHYVPFNRYGKYFVAVKDPSDKLQRLEFYDKKRQAETREAELRIDYTKDPKTADWRVYSGKNERGKLGITYQLSPTTIIFTRHVLEKFKEMGELNKDLADIYDDLDTIMRKWGNKFPTHLVKAEMVPGWSKDYIRSFASYIQGMSTFIANAKQASKVRAAIAKLDPIADRPLIDWMEQKYAFIKSRNSMSSGINRFLFSYYLAGNVKSALINSLQHLNSVAYSTKWLSVNESLKTHAIASKYAGQYLIGRPQGIPVDVLDIIEDLKSRGRVSAEAIETIAGISASKISLTNDAVRTLSIGFRKAEEFNRIHAVVTGYQIAKRLKLDREGTISFIERFINDTQYEYSKLGVPLIAQNPIIRPFWAFRTYTYNWLRVMKNLLQEKEYKTFVAMLTPLYALGGLTAIPFVQEALSAINAVTGFDLHTWLREKEQESGGNGEVTDMMVYGVPAAAVGAAVGASLNPFELPNIGTRTSLEEAALQTAMGPVGGLYQRVKRAVIMQQRYGDTYRAVENVMPEFVRNLMVTWRWKAEKGARAATGEPYAEDMTPGELTLRAFGIQPVRYLKGLEKVERMGEINESATTDTAKVNLLIAKQLHRIMSSTNDKEVIEAEEKLNNIIENLMAKNLEYAEKGEYHKMIIPDKRAIKMNVLRIVEPDIYHILKAPQKARPETLHLIQTWANKLNLNEEDMTENMEEEE